MRNDAKFQAIINTMALPVSFKWEEQSLLDWLVELTQSTGKEACSTTIYLLHSLNESSLSFKNRFIFLNMIRMYLKQYINRLEIACWDAGFPLSSEENIYAEMITWNYWLLGEGFFIAADSANKKNDAIVCLGMALEMLGLAQLHIAAIYATPNDSFWSLIYQIFAWAEKRKLQHELIENNELKGVSINTLFARCLIFQVADTNQFQPRDMRTLFKFLPKLCADLPITLYPQEWHGVFMLDLKSNNPPYNVNSQIELGSDLVRYFSPVIVAKTINQVIHRGDSWSGTLKSINNTLFARVAKTLGLEQKRQFQRKTENQSVLGVIGFEDIVNFLYKTSQNTPVHLQPVKTNRNNTNSLSKSELALIEKEEFHRAKSISSLTKTQIWEKSKRSCEIPMKKISLKEIKVCDSSANGYSVSWSQTTNKAKIGDLFGIISEDKKRLEIAIIRRIALSSDDVIRQIALNQGEELGKDFGTEFRFGAELLGFESEIIYLSDVENPNKGAWGVFIPGIELLNRPNTVIYNIEQFKIGQNIYIHRGHQVIFCLLLKELHSTTTISHVELIFIKNLK